MRRKERDELCRDQSRDYCSAHSFVTTDNVFHIGSRCRMWKRFKRPKRTGLTTSYDLMDVSTIKCVAEGSLLLS